MATLLCLRDVQTFVNLSRHDPTRLTATQPYLLDSIVLTINNALEVEDNKGPCEEADEVLVEHYSRRGAVTLPCQRPYVGP